MSIMAEGSGTGPRDVVSEGQIEYDGIRYPGFISEQVLDRVKQFPLQAEDICVATYPKAGTSWLEEIVYLVCHEADVVKTRAKSLEERTCFMEINVPQHGPLLDIFPFSSPRIFRTHLSSAFFKHVFNTPDCPKFIFGSRNIKDSLVSGYHFSRMNVTMGGFKGSWHDWFETFKLGRMFYGDWYDYNICWWEAHKENVDRILHVSYEDLHRNHRGNVEQIAKFLGKSFSEEALDEIVRSTTFGDMKEKGNLHSRPEFDETISPFMRKGKIGDWKNYFTEEQDNYIDQLHQKRMQDTDFKVEFEWK